LQGNYLNSKVLRASEFEAALTPRVEESVAGIPEKQKKHEPLV
jgi:hypothetical protein